jgi:hypothetical protein
MSGTTAIQAGSAERAARPGHGSGRRLRLRHLWLVPGIGIAIVASEVGKANGVTILMLIAFGIAPDLPRLLRLRGRPIHNLLHQPVTPLVAVALAAGLAATSVVPILWLVASLVWLGHVVAGIGVGDVPKRGGDRASA